MSDQLPSNRSNSYLVAVTTTDSEESATTLAEGLVRDRLAACVQISSPIKSVYRWEGAVQTETEWQLWIKTTGDLIDRLIDWVNEHHSYDVPELVILQSAGGNPAYLQWITDETHSTQP